VLAPAPVWWRTKTPVDILDTAGYRMPYALLIAFAVYSVFCVGIGIGVLVLGLVYWVLVLANPDTRH
jgi:hypothetical protein